MPFAYNALCSCQQWYNWTSTLIQPSTANAPVTAIFHSTLQNPLLPPIFAIFTFMLYIILTIMYQDSPGNGKFMMIAAIVLVISLFEATFGLVGNAIINVIIFIGAFFITGLFRSG